MAATILRAMRRVPWRSGVERGERSDCRGHRRDEEIVLDMEAHCTSHIMGSIDKC